MIPEIQTPDVEIVEQPTRTWRLDLDTKELREPIDGLDAVLQAAFLALQTPRFRHLIYSWQYGSELNALIGKDEDYALTEAKRMITEALLVDSRITTVKNFAISGKVYSFTIDTLYGSQQLSTEVITA